MIDVYACVNVYIYLYMYRLVYIHICACIYLSIFMQQDTRASSQVLHLFILIIPYVLNMIVLQEHVIYAHGYIWIHCMSLPYCTPYILM